ncbi:MAG: fluoride efflux transporter CrcB [Pirellulaceae bacterium]|jgi:CrcB protein|nr:fluoride efflux transporter CrcB [Pirellulaceae bacterium]
MIAACGAIGAVSRYLTSLTLYRFAGNRFPWGTLVVNVIGCFLLGLAVEYGLHRKDLPAHYQKAFTIGFLGALTTFSTFGLETFRALEKDWRLGALNAAANFGIGIIAVWVGISAGKSLH